MLMSMFRTPKTQRIPAITLRAWRDGGEPKLLLIFPPELAGNMRLIVQTVEPDGTWKSCAPRSVIGTGSMDRFRLYPLSFYPNEDSLATDGLPEAKPPDFWRPLDDLPTHADLSSLVFTPAVDPRSS